MDYDIPLFALNYGPEEEEAALAAIRSRWLSTGPRTAELERTFAAMLGSPYALAVSNCTAALHISMMVLGIGPGDEVIVPSLTFVATANCVRYVGATPVFGDVTSSSDLNIDPRHIEALITPRTKAVIVMHYGGFPCDMDAISAIAKKHNITVVEDACHAPLSEYSGRKLGTLGDMGCFSFFSNKNISTGEGGIMVFRKQEHYDRAKLLRSHGMTTLSYDRAKGHAVSYDVVALGHNYRMDDLRSALALVQLAKLPADLQNRAVLRATYLEQLRDVEEIIIPFSGHDGFVSNYIFPILVRESARRDSIREGIHSRRIQTSVHYPAVHRFSIHREPPAILPNTELATDSEITLPMFGSMTTEQVGRVCEALKHSLCTQAK